MEAPPANLAPRPGGSHALSAVVRQLTIARSPLSGPTMLKHFSICAIVVVLTVAGIREATAAEPQAGEVLALSGQCFATTAGRRNVLRPGDAVHVGESFDVSPGAKLKLRMDDGSVIALASGSRLTITDYRIGKGGERRNATLSLAQGLLRAVVSLFRGVPHFEVDTATGVAAVRSTDWFIEARLESTQVGVLNGRVSLKSVATGRSIVIPARWGARVEAGRDPVPARVWTAAEFADFIGRTNLE